MATINALGYTAPLPTSAGGTGANIGAISAAVAFNTSGNALVTIASSAGTAGLPFISNGTSTPSWTALTVAGGGTGRVTSTTAYGVICAGTTATGPQQTIASVGTSGQVLTSNGASALPTFQAASGIGGMALISAGTVSSAASLSFTSLTTGYDIYLLSFNNLSPSTSDVEFLIQVSTDNGSTWKNGASDNLWERLTAKTAAVSCTGSTGDVGIRLEDHFSGSAGYEGVGEIFIHNPADSSVYTRVQSRIFHKDYTSNALTIAQASGQRDAAEADNAFRVIFNTGNIGSMTYALYGLKNV